ncbi:Fanconi anemia group M protein isoform X2 [Trichomycterus rosablanca]|uniref:Fanconi anemia group M protein isoform X2 n=1 Tax=Trichomycterus rosablanca TaxID=2290929 RepID=UPI002F356A38
MSNSNQKTLFQTWGTSVPKPPPHKDPKKKPAPRRKTNPHSGQVNPRTSELPAPSLWTKVGQEHPAQQSSKQDDMDDDDDLMLVAVYEAEKSLESNPESSDPPSNVYPYSSAEVLPGYDSSSGQVWIYPTNYPIRDYQLKISEAALFQNTLVCLPTGLGKTFIASVVMYNFYRWYPAGRIVFMAPTKPLVAQQIEACYKVMGIPQQHMAELTGSTSAPQRRELWRTRRVFFLTPQVMVNDLSRNTCPATQIKCVVIDEAHKASGNHAYCQVVRELWNHTKQFRVLALSATPGGDMKAVQQVISNLLISHIELRSEESPDVQAHTHQRSLEKIVVPLGESLTGYQSRYSQVLERFTARLTQVRVLQHRDLRSLTKYQLILARDQFRRNPPPHVKGAQQGALEGDFALCISLCHGFELLQQMGLRSLFFFAQNIMSGTKEYSRARNELQRCPVFMDLYKAMETMFLTSTKGPEEPYFYSHPKLEKLDQVVLQHFRTWADSAGGSADPDDTLKGGSTRVMIFSSFRESVQEIAEMLNRHQPLVRVMTFMGQASAGKGVRGFTQKEQLEVVRRFREGGFNTLVSTCVGEEGLDIGDVDLIVCFDAQKSPIRLVQRMGRTGRHRQGRIVVILAEGREERTYNQSQSNRRSVNKSITGNKHSFTMFPHSPRMLPAGFTPTLHRMHITCGQFESKGSGRRSGSGRQSLAARRVSLLNPMDQADVTQECVKEDGFLSPAEHAEWSSSMKLGENEPHPVLRPSHFLSLTSEPQPQNVSERGPVRELSLWEWRHWQNRPFPTHRVDHSDRCRHFTAVMELIDQMKLEQEGHCRYDSEVMPYLKKEDVVGCDKDGRLAKPRCEKNPKRSKPKFNARDIRTCAPKANLNQTDQSASSSRTLVEDKDFSETVPDVMIIDDELSEVQPSKEEAQIRSPIRNLDVTLDVCHELEEMFYLPEWGVRSKPHAFVKSDANLQTILRNVRLLLSRSPPKDFDLHCSLNINHSTYLDESKQVCRAPSEEVDQYQVNFNLEDEDSVDGESSDPNVEAVRPRSAAGPEVPLVPSVAKASPESHLESPDSPEVLLDRKRIRGPAEFPGSPRVLLDRAMALASPESLSIPEALQDSRSPPKDFDLHCSLNINHSTYLDESKQVCRAASEEVDQYQVNFNLEDEDSVDSESSDSNTEAARLRSAAGLEVPLVRSGAEVLLERNLIGGPPRVPLDRSIEVAFSESPDIPEAPQDSNKARTLEVSSHNKSLNLEVPQPEGVPHNMDSADLAGADNSPSWDEVFEDLDDPPVQKVAQPPESKHQFTTLDESVDLFGDDEAFLQMSFPDIVTPKKGTEMSINRPQSQLKKRLILAPQDSSSSFKVPASPKTLKTPGPVQKPAPEQNSGSFNYSQDIFSVNFDLGVSFDSDEERTVDQASEMPAKTILNESRESSNSFTLGHASTPRVCRADGNPLQSLMTRTNLSPIVNLGPKVRSLRAQAHGSTDRLCRRSLIETGKTVNEDPPSAVNLNSDSDDEPVARQKKPHGRINPLASPELSKISDVESPVQGPRKRIARLNMSEESDGAGRSDDDFKEESFCRPREPQPRQRSNPQKKTKSGRRNARQFLDEEAELSEEEGSVSSDEDDGEELDRSLEGFVVNNTQFSQGINDSEMHGIYLKSVRSPVVSSRFRMVRKPVHNMNVFSQVPEQDETYEEDSFVVHGSDAEEDDDGDGDGASEAEVIPEDSFVDGRRQYTTRRRVQLRDTRAARETRDLQSRKTKRSRIIRVQDSSEEEHETEEERSKRRKRHHGEDALVTEASALHREERSRQRFNNQAAVSEELDFEEPPPSSLLRARASCASSPLDPPHASVGAGTGTVRVLVDSRCISSGAEVVSSLRLKHAAEVHVCSPVSCDFIVSARMAVEWQSESDLANPQGRRRLQERTQRLQALFDRACLIVEKDRTKPGGETARRFQRSRYYDATIAALVRAGVRLLVSSGPDDTAALLAQLAQLERRKGQGIDVPLEVRGHRQQALQFYLTLPCVSYVNGLHMCHGFSSVAQLVNSGVDALQAGARVSRARAEEIYRCLRYSCDTALLKSTSKTSA